MKKNGIIDHFEGDYIYVEIDEDTVKIPHPPCWQRAPS